VRNEAPFLAEALASLSVQTFEDFEVIVDDGSTSPRRLRGGTRATTRASESSDRGPRDSWRRFGVRAPRRAGRYLARMDGDDLAMPQRLALQLEAVESDRLDACGGGIEYFPRESVRDGARRYERVVGIDDAPRFADAFAVGAVSGAEGRSRVRELAAGQGRHDGIDFAAVA
jgi:glycosyltransferase involved in cell wall biosynthesis